MGTDSVLAPFVRILGGIATGSITPNTGADGSDIGTGRLEVVPTGIAGTYNSVAPPQIQTSSVIDCRNSRRGAFGFNLASANTPTDFRFAIEFARLTPATWMLYTQADWASLLFEDTETAGVGIARIYPFEVLGNMLRLVCTATGTSAANTFTLSSPIVLLWT